MVGALALEKNNDETGEEYLLARFLAQRDQLDGALDVISKALEHGSPDRGELLRLRQEISV